MLLYKIFASSKRGKISFGETMTVENAIMRLNDLIMEREELTKLIAKEMNYEISDSAKTSVIATVDFLNDEIATLKEILKELD